MEALRRALAAPEARARSAGKKRRKVALGEFPKWNVLYDSLPTAAVCQDPRSIGVSEIGNPLAAS
ncbi:MAG: hypothetical protein K0Q64_984 [Nitrobacter vulgaris]|jgi:hypothetical protein|nr:hypothetical protein [Nitrobacter vulgaris]